MLRATSLFIPKPSFAIEEARVNWQTDESTNKPHGSIDFLVLSLKKDSVSVIIDGREFACLTGNSVKTSGTFNDKASG